MVQRRLRLVADDDAGAGESAAEQRERSPVERVFDHWVFMLGKNPKVCALGPKRRQAIDRALRLYDEGVLLLAIEGCAASAWHNGDNDRDRAFNDIELILRDEAHVERFAADGEQLRALAARRAERERQRLAAAQAPAMQADTVQADEDRDRLRRLAKAIRDRGTARG